MNKNWAAAGLFTLLCLPFLNACSHGDNEPKVSDAQRTCIASADRKLNDILVANVKKFIDLDVKDSSIPLLLKERRQVEDLCIAKARCTESAEPGLSIAFEDCINETDSVVNTNQREDTCYDKQGVYAC